MSYLLKKEYSFNKYVDKDLKITDSSSKALEFDTKEEAQKVSDNLKDNFEIVKKH